MPLDSIVKFNVQRGLKLFNAKAELLMLEEELQEFKDAFQKNDEHEMVDALCDIIVLATGAIHKLGYDPTKALLETTNEIHSRKGAFNESVGKWQKDLNQDPASLYKANYDVARY